MIYRMGAALMSLLGLFVSAYLYLYKIGRIGTLACGTGGCETVQTSEWSRFLGRGGGAHRRPRLRGCSCSWPCSRSARPARSGGARRRCSRRSPAGGVLFTLYLTYLELFVIHAICRWCVGSAAIIVTILILALLELKRSGAAAAPVAGTR